jgi:hypothetical protein
MARPASVTTSVVVRGAGRMDASNGSPDGRELEPKGRKRKQGLWAAIMALWRTVRRAILDLPKLVRWLLLLAGAGVAAVASALLGGSNASAGAKALFTQGPGAFWAYLQQQPLDVLARRFPFVFVIVVVVGLFLIVIASMIRKDREDRERVGQARRGYLEALGQKEHLKDSEVPAKLNHYLDQLCKRYDTLELPGMEPLRLSEVAITLPLVRTVKVSGTTSRTIDRSAASDQMARGDTPGQWLASLLGVDDWGTRVMREDSIDDIPSRVRRFIVVGGPDSGKSTLLKLQVIMAAQHRLNAAQAGQRADGPLPVYLTAPDIVAQGTISAALREMLKRLDADERLTEYLMRAIHEGWAVVCVDNLDTLDAAGWAALAESLALMEVSNKTTVLLASRAGEPPSGPLARAEFKTWELQDLTAVSSNDRPQGATPGLPQRLAERLFAAFDRQPLRQAEQQGTEDGTARGDSSLEEAQAFIEALKADPRSNTWSGNPLLFSVAAAMYAQERHLPPNRVDMYRRLLTETQRGGRIGDEVERHLLRRVLADLALWLYRWGRRTLTLDDLLTFLLEIERETPLGASQLGDLLRRESVLEEAGGGRLGFRYDAFVEYLAAVALAQNLASSDGARRDAAIQALLDDYPLPEWRDALVLVPSVLVQEYGRQGTEVAYSWLRTLLSQAETPAGDPAATGLELVLDALTTLGVPPVAWTARGIADDIGAAWVAELRRAGMYGQRARQRQLLNLADRLTQIGEQTDEQTNEAASEANAGQAAGLQVQAAFGDPDPRVRETMAQAMLKLSRHARIQEIVEILLHGQPTARATAARILWDLPVDTEGRHAAFQAALSDDSWPVRFLALTGLAGEVPAEDLASASRDEASVVQLAAEACLALQKRAGPQGWIGTLLRMQWEREGLSIDDERATLRTYAAAIGVESVGVLAERQFGDVINEVRRSSEAVADEPKALAAPQQAAEPTEQGEATTPGAEPESGEADNGDEQSGSESPGEQARQAAVRALHTLGILNADTLAALRDAVGDSNPAIRAAASLALGVLALLEAITPDEAGDPASSLRDENVMMRVVGLIWLAFVEDDPTATLRTSLDDAAPAVRLTAVLLLGLFVDEGDNAAENALIKDLLVGKTRDSSFAVAMAASLMLAMVVPPPVARDTHARILRAVGDRTLSDVTYPGAPGHTWQAR